jgi:hypothetical protein
MGFEMAKVQLHILLSTKLQAIQTKANPRKEKHIWDLGDSCFNTIRHSDVSTRVCGAHVQVCTCTVQYNPC